MFALTNIENCDINRRKALTERVAGEEADRESGELLEPQSCGISVKTTPEPRAMSIAALRRYRDGVLREPESEKSRWNRAKRIVCTLEQT